MKHLLYKWLSMLGIVLAACGSPGDTTPPTLSLSASSTNVTAAGNLTLTADAKDNVAVTKVEFFDGTTKLGEDTTSADGFTRIVPLTAASNGTKSYTAKAFDAAGNNKTSPALTVTVNISTDTTGPTLLSSTATSNTAVSLVFNEAIVGGDNPLNFSITPSLNVTGASVSGDSKTVTLTTAAQTPNQTYTVSVANVKDLAGNPFDKAATQPSATQFSGIGPDAGILLNLSIEGLPAGVLANVEVSGPKGYSQILNQSSSLKGLESGSYSFKVNAVKPDSATFSDDASPSSLNFDASVGGNVTLKYVCSEVKPPDAVLDAKFTEETGKASYNCADLAKLTTLIAEESDLVNFEGIQYATGLTYLSLGGNKIAALPAGIFDKLTNLTGLELSSNQIVALPPGIFDKLTGLTSLGLFKNQIVALPPGIFDKLTGLTYLSLGANQIAALPAGIFDKLTGLTSLDLRFNQIAALPAGIFDKLTELADLNLFNNQIAALPAGIFDKLTGLTSLDLAANKIAALPNGLTTLLPKMTFMDISFNCLATQQSPIKEMLKTFNPAGSLLNNNNPKAGCPQKTIRLISIQSNTLTTPNQGANIESVRRAVLIDGVAQDFGLELPGEASKGKVFTFNQTFLVLSNLTIDVVVDGLSIGTVSLPVDASYTPGQKTFTLTGRGSEYVVTLELK